MKKYVLLLLFAVLSLEIGASGYCPNLSIEASLLEEKVEGDTLPSLSWGGRVELLSWKIGRWGISLPFSGETITPSFSSIVFIPRRSRLSLGTECNYSFSRITLFLGIEKVITDFSDIKAVISETRMRSGVGIQIARYLEIRFPFSYVFSQVTPGFSFSVSMKVGGEI